MKPSPAITASLPEVHSSVTTARPTVLRRMLAFAGPAYLVSVGYMDPGNWATDLVGGSSFGYRLLWVIVLSNLMAILLQTLAARLGIVAGRDLAQACREAYPKLVCNVLWALCEIAIAACDLAEVLGAAIGLKLLFHIPLIDGVLVTALDTILVLWLSRFGIRVIEAAILSMIAIMTGCFLVELFFAHPAMHDMLLGLTPQLDSTSLYVAVTIVGATVMPHNLYLHSALVQTRRIGKSDAEKREACRFNLVDSVVALNGALIVNAAILVLAAAVFYNRHIIVEEIEQAQGLLSPLLGTTIASGLFAVALLASGQSSTLTGTYAGQIVMEGFLDLRMRPWMRRLVTRTLAIIPAVITIRIAGDRATLWLLLLSQAIISMQLPFAVIPLIRFTNDRERMGSFANRAWVKTLAWATAAVILGLNLWLVVDQTTPWVVAHPLGGLLLVPPLAAVLALLAWITFAGARPQTTVALAVPEAATAAVTVTSDLPAPVYRRILVPLDHSSRDRAAIAHAAYLSRLNGATLYLVHVEEGATSRLFGSLADDAEVHAGREYFRGIVASLAAQNIAAELTVTHGSSPQDEIVKLAREIRPDLIVMGAHGHRGVKDLVLGNTINAVRHEVDAPVLVVGHEPG
jgi:manganese transport protein